MAGNGPQNHACCHPPPKPWERAGSSCGPVPFKPPSYGSTSAVVEASGTANPGEIVSTSGRKIGVNANAIGRPLPSRPWENNGSRNSYGGYCSGLNNSCCVPEIYNSRILQSGLYGSGGGMYGSNMYRGGGYGEMYNGGLGRSLGGCGMGGPYGPQDPNNPYGEPPSPPGFWMSFLRVIVGIANFSARISNLLDQNTQAVHLFMSALLQLFDSGGLLYGELARFAMRVLGVKTKPRKLPGPKGLSSPQIQAIEGPKPAPAGGWDNVWEIRGNDMNR